MIKKFLKTALATALLAVAGAQTAGAEDADSHGLYSKQVVVLRAGNNNIGINGTWGNNFGNPNGPQGRWYIERTAADTYILATQGLYLTGITNGNAATYGSRTDAIGFTATGSQTFAQGNGNLNLAYNGVYLGNNIKGSETAVQININAWNNGANDVKIDCDFSSGVNGNYYATLCMPYKVRPNTGGHCYLLERSGDDIVLEEVSVVPAGQPFIYKTNTNGDPGRRLLIVQKAEEIDYVEKPVKAEGTLLDGIFWTGAASTRSADPANCYRIAKNAGANNLFTQQNGENNTAFISATTWASLTEAQQTAIKKLENLTVVRSKDVVVPEAKAAFATLKAVAVNIGTEPNQYNYNLTTDEQTLVNTAYDTDEPYEALSAAAVEALITQFINLTAAIKATYVWPDVSIVTLQFNGQNRYSGWNNNNSTGNQWADLGTPNGVNGRVALLKQSDGKFVISSQGLYLKNTQQSTFNLGEATKFTMTGSFTDGLTFQAEDGNYLTGSTFGVSATEPTNKFKVNTFNMYTKASDTDGYVTDGNGNYANALCYPVRVKKPGEGYHMYTVKVVGGALQTTEVNEVPAGVPFIYVRPNNNNNDGDRLIIDQDNQEYAATPATDNLLQGYYLQDQKVDAKFYFGVHDGVFGFYTDVELGTATNRAYITAASAAALDGAKLFQLINGELVVTQAHTVTYKLQDADGNKLADDVVVEDAVHGSAPAAPAAFQAGYVTLTKTDGPDVINADATIVYTATWDVLPFELGSYYNLIMRTADVRYAQSGSINNVKAADLDNSQLLTDNYLWKFEGTPYAITVTSKDGKTINLTDGSNEATLATEGDATTYTIERVNDTDFRLKANGITGKQVYMGDYSNDAKIGRWGADAGNVLRATEAVNLSVGTAGYATFCSEKALDFTNVHDVKAYRAEREGDVVSFTQVTGAVPAEEGLLIKGTKDTEVNTAIPVATGTPDAISNVFKGTLVDLTLQTGDYVLYQTAFYVVGQNSVTLPAGKAYIPKEAAAGARIAKLDFDETTGISEMKTMEQNSTIYNLNGVRVAQPTKGLYIVNGKKMVVK